MERPKIFVSTSSFGEYSPEPINILKDAGCTVKLNPHGRKLTEAEVVELAGDSQGLIAGTENLDKETLKAFSHLKVISRCGVGIENVDLREARTLGIMVVNTPEAPTTAVAELTVGLILNLLRCVSQQDRVLRMGQWQKKMGFLLEKKNVGIVGYGRIGRKVSAMLKSFNCNIAFSDPYQKSNQDKQMSLEGLLAWADILTVHVSSDKALIGAQQIAAMKKGSYLINVSRGGVVDEKALHEALTSQALAGAALDVFEQEPYTGPLKDVDNVILTPHIGSYAKESRILMECQAAENLLKLLQNE